MTSSIRAFLGSSLMVAAFVAAPIVASAQTPAAATTTTTPKVKMTKAQKAAAKSAAKAAAAEPKSVKVAETKVATAKVAAKKAVVSEKKAAAVAAGDTKAEKKADAKVVAAKTAEKKADAKVAAAKTAETKAVKTETKAVAAADMVGCTDGTMSKGGRGACSGHGGVKTTSPAKAVENKMAAAPMTSPKAVAHAAPKSAVAVTDASNTIAAGATAKCKDGTFSHSKTHTGSCSGHGGVASWM